MATYVHNGFRPKIDKLGYLKANKAFADALRLINKQKTASEGK